MPENPYESSRLPTGASGAASSIPALVWLGGGIVGVGAILFLLAALLLPTHRGAREAPRRVSCMNQMKQIALAMHNYANTHGTLPPAYTVDEHGNRLHSWRSLILPYVEEEELFKRIDFTKPWDDPANEFARSVLTNCYTCPSFPGELLLTKYAVVVGPNCAFTGAKPRKLGEFPDGTSNTILIVELSDDKAVHWMSPEDATLEDVLAMDENARTNHFGIFNVAMVDGSSRSISLKMDRDQLRALLTANGGEEVD